MYEIVKVFIDKIGAILLLIIFLPFFIFIPILIKLSSKGPVLLEQIRLGKNAKPFTFYKFRTMYVADNRRYGQDFVSNLISGRYGEIGETPIYKLSMDPRITTFGRFLRKASLDELPQLLNILKGDMSLVGPRPPIPYELNHYEEWHKERLSVKPGITGLWQVVGRSSTTFDEMVRMDIEYARRKSIILDLKLLLKTPLTVLSGKGAY